MLRHFAFLVVLILTTSAFSHEEEAQEEFFISTPEQIATLRNDHLIGGLISPMSGHLALKQTDLIVKGAQNITLDRVYIPPYIPCSFPQKKHSPEAWEKYFLYQHVARNYKGWQFYPHLKLQFTRHAMKVLVTDTNGVSLEFRLSGPNASITTLASLPFAISNTAGDVPN